MTLFLGVDLGSTKTAVSVWTVDAGEEAPVRLGTRRWPTPPEGPEIAIGRMIEEGQALLDEAGVSRELTCIGISGGGPVDPEAGVVLSVPNLSGWENVPLTARLADAFGVPAAIENDANACALAEWRYGAGRGVDDLVFLTCSTGIGAGLILGGRLYRGATGLAGELGHVEVVFDGLPCGCGRRGCLEAYASGAGMARRLEILRQDDPTLPANAQETVERARQGDEFALVFLRETARWLARGLAPFIFCVNPARVILGTIPTAAGELVLEPLRQALTKRVWPALLDGLEVLPSGLWPDLGDHAALAVAQELDRD